MSEQTQAAAQRFHDALNAHDIDAVAGCITDDCVFEDTEPPPDGARHTGRKAVLDAIRQFFAESPAARFETEEMVVAGNRALVRWRYTWADGHVRGVDVLRVHDGRVAESLAYVKG
jgi:ketosteroid isomerase-like protein